LAVQNAIGGDDVTMVIQGRARYPVNVRLPREARDNLDALRQVLVGGSANSDPTPLGRMASVQIVPGPSMIRDENAMPTGYVYLDLDGRDPEDYIREAADVLAKKLILPRGYTLSWSGQYEAFERIHRRLMHVVPLTMLFIALLLYGSTRSIARTGLVLLAVPFSAIGAIWSLYILGYPMSPAVWVGLIALLGVDTETGTFMVLYLDLAWQERAAKSQISTQAGLRDAVLAGAVRRIRPKFMTVATMFLGFVPIFWSTGAGAEIMKRIAAPMIGGLATSFLMELIVYPVLYEQWKSRALPRVLSHRFQYRP
jgi:Cu(I)/Ag(I) efflux system membrane protein CusA/SilA